MSMITEVPTLKFKFNSDPLPLVACHLAFRFAIGKSSLERLYHVAELARDHTE